MKMVKMTVKYVSRATFAFSLLKSLGVSGKKRRKNFALCLEISHQKIPAIF
ncbi:hypothetical protein XENTR_v10012924 [Xenopus tropicalis]|nr:hypothetical protein XENTR_v10012924 [Xenopus tropicalis]